MQPMCGEALHDVQEAGIRSPCTFDRPCGICQEAKTYGGTGSQIGCACAWRTRVHGCGMWQAQRGRGGNKSSGGTKRPSGTGRASSTSRMNSCASSCICLSTHVHAHVQTHTHTSCACPTGGHRHGEELKRSHGEPNPPPRQHTFRDQA